MRAVLFALAIGAALVADGSSGQAAEGPWCAWTTIGGEGNGIENCSMRSYEMCRQEITGGDRGSCYPNPRYGGGNEAVRSRRPHH